jgi:hypothetical protein
MSDHQKRDQWLQDIEAGQRNVVFPDTVQNEARFWRNLGKGPSSTSARAGLVVLAIFLFVWAAIILVATYKGGCLLGIWIGDAPLLWVHLRSHRLGHSPQSPQYSERSTRPKDAGTLEH